MPALLSAALTRRHLAAAALLALLLAPVGARAQSWAVDGYDPVALREQGQLAAGSARIMTRWQGKVWHFVSEDNRAAFEANPREYAPGFDGICPVTLEEGRPAQGDPRQFVIIGERVYFTRSEQARAQLLADPRGVLMGAKQRWVAQAR